MDITDKQLKRLIKCHKLVLFIIYLLIQIPPKETNQYCPLPYGILTAWHIALCQPLLSLKAGKICIFRFADAGKGI